MPVSLRVWGACVGSQRSNRNIIQEYKYMIDTIDARGLACPVPVLKTKKRLEDA